MSPRTDYILSLCLEQADKSPLHYRHGSVIIRGGKVIGLGHNSYQPGFDGGALKTGVLPSGSDINAITSLKEHLKYKSKYRSKSNPHSHTFKAFERSNSHVINTPLSMHSEMMAIQSALSLSSSAQTSARTARWLQKPCCRLSGGPKRKARSQALRTYVETACAEAEQRCTRAGETGFSLQESRFGTGAFKRCQSEQLRQQQCGQPETEIEAVEPVDTSSDEDFEDNVTLLEKLPDQQSSPAKSKPKLKNRSQPSVVSKQFSRSSKADLASRMKDNRLNGADLYVARLGSMHDSPPASLSPPLSQVTPFRHLPVTGSLHDEIKSHPHTPAPSSHPESSYWRPIRASRPCYRCITHMHAVGIKRVLMDEC